MSPKTVYKDKFMFDIARPWDNEITSIRFLTEERERLESRLNKVTKLIEEIKNAKNY